MNLSPKYFQDSTFGNFKIECWTQIWSQSWKLGNIWVKKFFCHRPYYCICTVLLIWDIHNLFPSYISLLLFQKKGTFLKNEIFLLTSLCRYTENKFSSPILGQIHTSENIWMAAQEPIKSSRNFFLIFTPHPASLHA